MADGLDSLAFAASDLNLVRKTLDDIDISASKVSRSLTSAFSNAILTGKSFDQTLQMVGLSLDQDRAQRRTAAFDEWSRLACRLIGRQRRRFRHAFRRRRRRSAADILRLGLRPRTHGRARRGGDPAAGARRRWKARRHDIECAFNANDQCRDLHPRRRQLSALAGAGGERHCARRRAWSARALSGAQHERLS